MKRDRITKLVFCYDALNREIVKYLHKVACGTAGAATDVFTDYDLAGRHLHVRYQSRTGTGVDYAYDSAGRATSETAFKLRDTSVVSRTFPRSTILRGRRVRRFTA